MKEHGITDATMATIGSKATYTGATSSIIGWLMSSEFGVLAGIMIGIAGLLVNWYYRHRQDKRDEEEHRKRMSE